MDLVISEVYSTPVCCFWSIFPGVDLWIQAGKKQPNRKQSPKQGSCLCACLHCLVGR